MKELSTHMSDAGERALIVNDLSVTRGGNIIIRSASFVARGGELTLILGAQGAGKSSLIRALVGVLKSTGQIGLVENEEQLSLDGRPPVERAHLGFRLVQDAGDIFMTMTVLENLHAGAYLRRDREGIAEDMERIFVNLPALRPRLHQIAGTLSGGELRILGIARALIGRPRVLFMDEPSSGLAPSTFQDVLGIIAWELTNSTVVVMAEQNAADTLDHAQQSLLLQDGRIVHIESTQHALKLEEIGTRYLR